MSSQQKFRYVNWLILSLKRNSWANLMLKKLICINKMFILEQFNQNLPYFWERVTVQGMLVWFLTRDFVGLCFLDKFFIYLFYFFNSTSVIFFIELVLLLIHAVLYNFDTQFLKSKVLPGVITTIFIFTKLMLHGF